MKQRVCLPANNTNNGVFLPGPYDRKTSIPQRDINPHTPPEAQETPKDTPLEAQKSEINEETKWKAPTADEMR